MNKIMLIGNLGRDPEMNVTNDGIPVTKFSLAVNRKIKSKNGERSEETDWFTIVAWRELAELCNTYLTKGAKVYVEGRVQQPGEGQSGPSCQVVDHGLGAQQVVLVGEQLEVGRRPHLEHDLPVVVGQMGVGGVECADANIRRFKESEAQGVDRPEFKGNVALVKTDAFWDTDADAVFKKGWEQHKSEWDTVGSDYPYHYLGSAKTMCRIGRAFGEAMLDLRRGRN